MSNQFQFLIYNAPDGDVHVNAIVKDETIWLTQKAMAELFGVQQPAISKHLKNIFEEGELSEDSVVSKMEYTAADGKNYVTQFYNLDAIISARQARQKAESEYDAYNKHQPIDSDFDKEVRKLLDSKN